MKSSASDAPGELPARPTGTATGWMQLSRTYGLSFRLPLLYSSPREARSSLDPPEPSNHLLLHAFPILLTAPGASPSALRFRPAPCCERQRVCRSCHCEPRARRSRLRCLPYPTGTCLYGASSRASSHPANPHPGRSHHSRRLFPCALDQRCSVGRSSSGRGASGVGCGRTQNAAGRTRQEASGIAQGAHPRCD